MKFGIYLNEEKETLQEARNESAVYLLLKD